MKEDVTASADGWIEILFKRHTAAYALRSAFLLNDSYRLISDEADARPKGRDALRHAALARLSSHEEGAMSYSLIVLAVVGLPEDLAVVEPLRDHASDVVRRAARACVFKLKKKGPSTSGAESSPPPQK